MVLNFSSFIRHYSSNKNRSFYVTTPIFYVNAAPHIGHLYSAVIADAVYRYQKIKDPEKLYKFSTGTDEHGIKIQQAAAANKIPTSDYCEKISKEYEKVFKLAGIQYTDFIRTSEERHKNTVRQFWNKLKSNDYLYSSTYSGWYCVSDETFLTENQLKLNSDGKKISAETGHPVEWTDEQNYIFKLSKLQSDVIEWIKEGNHIKPKKFEKILLDYLNEPLSDLSVSRPTTRVKWGIKVPDDDTQTIYVWLDALVNYLTCSGYLLDSKDKKFWPPTLQIIGKDILKFHGIYWPAFLIAAGLELPECLLVHSHWTVDGEKMSKSKFNVIDPIDRSNIYTMEGLRYFLLREGVAHSDGNYSDIKILRILNSELADTLGNLLSRCCAKTLNPRQIYPKIHLKHFDDILKFDSTKNLIETLNQLPGKCEKHYEDCNFYMVVDQCMKTLHAANNFFETCKPWELMKKKQTDKINIRNKSSIPVDIETVRVDHNENEEENINKLETIISIVMNTLRICGIILQPIIPEISKKLLDKLNVSYSERYWKNLKLSQYLYYVEEVEKDGQQLQLQLQQKQSISENEINTNKSLYIKYPCCNIENEKNLGITDAVLFRRIIIEPNQNDKNEMKNFEKRKLKKDNGKKI